MIGLSALSGAQVVQDTSTGLTWQDNAQVKNTQMNYDDAMSYCSDLVLDGYDDWRLPSIVELESLVDLKRYYPAIKKVIKNVSTSGSYWSSTSFTSDSSEAWLIGFKSGNSNYINKSVKLYVRCVRGRQ